MKGPPHAERKGDAVDQCVARQPRLRTPSVSSGGDGPPARAGDAGDVGLIPGLGRSPGGGNGNPLQHSCLKNPTDRAWWATVPGVAKSQTRLSD